MNLPIVFEHAGQTYTNVRWHRRGSFIETTATSERGESLLCVFNLDGTLKRGAYEPLDTTWPKARAAGERIQSVN